MCGHEHHCMPKCCKRRCVGTFTTKFRVYENCCYDVKKICSYCGCEFNYTHPGCPKCGMMQMGDPPRFGGGFRSFGGFRRFGGFGFGRRRFFPFGFGFFPEFEEEEEEEDEF